MSENFLQFRFTAKWKRSVVFSSVSDFLCKNYVRPQEMFTLINAENVRFELSQLYNHQFKRKKKLKTVFWNRRKMDYVSVIQNVSSDPYMTILKYCRSRTRWMSHEHGLPALLNSSTTSLTCVILEIWTTWTNYDWHSFWTPSPSLILDKHIIY